MANSRINTIANNSIFLYFRSFVVLLLGIYTSRVLLDTLGIDDYGLYNLVAGIVMMFTSLRTILASSVQRFLNYEKGKGDNERVNLVFNQGIITHIGIAAVFIIIVEAAGIWFIRHKLSIPDGSMDTALFVFHTSVATAVLTILGTTFDAVIIANEKMKVFAGLTMFDAVLKLAIVYLLPVLGFTYLRSYAVLMMSVGVVNIAFNMWYCRRFDECRLSFRWDSTLFRELFSFAGWNFLGNTAFALVNEGINLILNIFGGVAVNAARGIAYQVKAAASTLSNNLIVAAQPFIMQKAATQDKETIFRYTFKMSRLMFLILLCTVFPIIIYTEEILDIWLVDTPEYSVIFVQLILAHLVQRALHSPVDTMFKAFGEIRAYQIWDSLSIALSLPLSYAILSAGFPLYSAFIVICLVEVINLVTITVCAKRKFGMSLKAYFKEVTIHCLLAAAAFTILALPFTLYLQPDSLSKFILYETIAIITEMALAYLLLQKEEREYLNSFIRGKLRE